MSSNISARENGTREPARWSLRLFGGFELSVLPTCERVASLGKRERALLAYLALSPKGRQPRRKLAMLIWSDATDQTLLDNLRTCLWRLRKALGDTEHLLIASDDEDIVLDIAAFEIDVLSFRCAAAQSTRTELETAGKLYGGEFLDGFELNSEEFDSWRQAEARHYLDQAVDVLSRLMNMLIECAETERAIEVGARILRFEPLHEATARHMMQLYAQTGRRGTAIQLYRTLTQALRRDVNTQPESATRLGFAAIARTGEEPVDVDNGPPRRRTRARHTNDVPTGLGPPVRPAHESRISLALLGAGFIFAVALGFYGWLGPRHVAVTAQTQQPGIGTDRTAPIAHSTAIPIAVLPFANLSGDISKQFFSDGMTEEISTALAKVPGLQIIARASAFRFRGEKEARSAGKDWARGT